MSMHSDGAPPAPDEVVHSNLTSIPLVRGNPSNNHVGFDCFLNDYGLIMIMVLLALLFCVVAFSIFIGIRTRTTDGDATNNNGVEDNRSEASTEGLDKIVVQSFPVFTYNLAKGLKAQAQAKANGSDCAVCLSDFQDEEALRLVPMCSHAFHVECIDMWLCSHTTCPVCRTSLLPEGNSKQVMIWIDNEGGV